MFEKLISQHNSSVGLKVKKFGQALGKSLPLFRKDNCLIFLCGANQGVNQPSERRCALKKFIESQSSGHRVVYAEAVFDELVRQGDKDNNLLDMENDISRIVDIIVIVLESPSAVCELGAFSHSSLRSKLVVINSSCFRDQESFINKGPIEAIEKSGGSVLWYDMKGDGVSRVDGIGSIFKGLRERLDVDRDRKFKKSKIDIGSIVPLSINKECLYLVHDIVFFMGPVSYRELVEFFISAFGKRKYDILKNILAILNSSGMIKVDEIRVRGKFLERVYRVSIQEMYLDYSFDIMPLISAARRENFVSNPWRFKNEHH